jgi:hypothetical protein
MNAETIGRLRAPIVGTATKHLSHSKTMSLQIMPLPSMVNKTNEAYKFLAANETSRPCIQGVQAFFFLGVVGWSWIFFCCSHQVLNMLASDCQRISPLNMFPNFPIYSQQHYQFLSNYALPSCLHGSYIGESILRVICFYEYLYIGGVSQVS